MIQTSNLGFPRIGLHRELKFALEGFWKNKLDLNSLQQTANDIQIANWQIQKNIGIESIPSNDFSFYDQVLDTAVLFNAIPPRFLHTQIDGETARYFAMARGFQAGDLRIDALEMTKWFNTNYHYLVPEISKNTCFKLNNQKPLQAYCLAKSMGVSTRPVIIGPLTFLLLSKPTEENFRPIEKLPELLPVYQQLFKGLKESGVSWIQLDEPFLVTDMAEEIRDAYQFMFSELGNYQPRPKVMLTSYFDDISINKDLVFQFPFEGIHLDITNIDGPLDLIERLPFLETLSLGVINGRNVWKENLTQKIDLIKALISKSSSEHIQIAPSCSLIHVPQDLDLEDNLNFEIKGWLSFAKQKLEELVNVKQVLVKPEENQGVLTKNQAVLEKRNQIVRELAVKLEGSFSNSDIRLERQSAHSIRKLKQKTSLPILPTTTIGSFPQTSEVRKMRAKADKGEINQSKYDEFLRSEIRKVIQTQIDLGLDVLVHGEFERNDMVQYFAEKMEGFAFTNHGWVQSFGSRYVRPPIIYAPVNRPTPMTIEWIKYAQSLTKKPVKGMLTGPVTILQWSFARDDQPISETCREIALAIRDEVLDLEADRIKIIQIDEPALREGLPLQRAKRQNYLTWAVDCFKIVSSSVRDETQIHTHMCYAEFNDIIEAIAKMDADVISIEASRSNMQLLKAFADFQYPNDIGPGIYDIHSPNIPSVNEMFLLLEKAAKVIPVENLWVNPDCGLKTRGWNEVIPSLKAMVSAAIIFRETLHL